ncbi:MAG: phosphatidate cytidylyltransferase [Solirubrobacteraceae bacterium]
MPVPRKRPAELPEPTARRHSDFARRVLVAVPAAVLAIVVADVGGIAWMTLMAVLGLICLAELYPLLANWRPVPVVGFVAVIGMTFAAHFGSLEDVVGVAVAALPLSFLAILARGQTKEATLAVASTTLGVMWIGFAFALAVLLRDGPHGNGVVIDVMLGTFLGDTAAYIGGRLFGRHKLVPTISPKKTVEGLGIGALVAVLAVVIAGFYQEAWMAHGTALLLGFAIAIFGPLGDLFESLIKRDAGAKDAGSIFGAHGGALDRLDAAIFTIVVTYYIWTNLPH